MIIDFHTHIFPPEIRARRAYYCEKDAWLAELYGNPRARMATADELVAAMDAAGVNVSVTFPFGWSDPGLAEECNSYTIQAMREYPGRLIGLAAIQPKAGPRAIAELERCARAGMPGMGELMPHGQGYRLSELTLLQPLMEAALALDLFVLTHVSEPVGHTYLGKGNVSVADLATFSAAFPQLRIVAAHWGGGYPFYELMPEVRDAARNIWYDTAASPFLYRADVLPIGAQLVGAEKILFGSDYPLITQERMLSYIQGSGLSAAAIRAITGANAQRFLRLDRADPGKGVS